MPLRRAMGRVQSARPQREMATAQYIPTTCASRSPVSGQGVLLLGEVLAEAGMIRGKRGFSWLPSSGPEMRSGTSNCHVRISGRAVDSPLVSRPNILVAMNEPSLAKLIDSVQPGGWLFYNESECRRAHPGRM